MHHAHCDRRVTLPKLALSVLGKFTWLKFICTNGAEIEGRKKAWVHEHNKTVGMMLDIKVEAIHR